MPKSYDKLEQELKELETQQQCLQAEMRKINSEMISMVKTASIPIKATHDGYLICLGFGSGSHIGEWCDETKGWRKRGLGTRYSSEQEAEQRLATLKARWPNYPLKIMN